MSEHATDEAILDGTCAPDLLHLLTCPTCRAWAIARLLEPVLTNEDETPGEYDAVFERLGAPSAAEIEASRVRRAKVETLREELLRIPGKLRLQAVRQASFQSMDLLDLLLEESHASQLTEAAKGAELAALAFELADAMEDKEGASAALPRSLLLEANALRLLGDRSGAEVRLGQAAAFLSDRMDRAFYCRVVGLVRWEDGRTDEGAAVLGHAVKLYQAEGLEPEVGACLALCGLLEVEEGQLANALPRLTYAWAAMDREIRPLFALQTGLALARCLAEVDQGARARSVLREVWHFYSEVKDHADMLRVYWGEALALARLQEWDEAIHILESVQLKLVDDGGLAEAALLSLDLALVLAEAGRSAEILSLAASLPADFIGSPQAASALRDIAGLGKGQKPNLRASATLSRVTLLRTFRLCGLSIRPLPFA